MRRTSTPFGIVAVVAAFAVTTLCLAGPPNAPTNLTLIGALSTQSSGNWMSLKWDDTSRDDAGFIVQLSTDDGHSWTSAAYSPSDYVILHSGLDTPAIGNYPGLLANTNYLVRVVATHPVNGQSSPSKEIPVTMPATATSTSPWELLRFPDTTGHVGFPIDLGLIRNRSTAGTNQYCTIDVPTGMTVDFNGGLINWTPTQTGLFNVTLGFGAANGLTHVCITPVATTSFAINVDAYTMSQPLFRDYRSEAQQVPIIGGYPGDFGNFGFYSSDLCSTYTDLNCPLSIISENGTGPLLPPSLLATWDVSSSHPGDRKLLTMITQMITGANSALYDPVILDSSSFNANWPKRLPFGSARGALAVDVTGDGVDEIIANSRDPNGGPFCWNLDGTLRWQAPPSELTTSDPAVGDVNGDGVNDVVHMSRGHLRVFNGPDGALIASVALTTGQFGYGPSLADLDNDGKMDILVTKGNQVFAYKFAAPNSLVVMSGWPVTVPADATIAGLPATADLDGDHRPEVIVNGYTKLLAWKWTGVQAFAPATLNIPTLPQSINGGGDPGTQPSIADIDGDGLYEIVVGQNVHNRKLVFVRCLSTNACDAVSPAQGMTAAIGEFDRSVNGPEVLLGSSVFSALTGQLVRYLGGGPTWGGLSSIVDGGLDDQQQPENYAIMGTMNGTQYTAGLSAFGSDGGVETGYPKSLYGNTASGSAPQAGDFDGDGYEDVLVEITDATYGAVVALYRTSTPFNAANNPWPMSGHDPQRTGRYSCKQQRQSCSAPADCCSNRCSTTCK